MENLNSWIASYSKLTAYERERSRQLIGAYNAAVIERQTKASGTGHAPRELFTYMEVEQLVFNYQAKNFAEIGPAMTRYLELLDQGYVWPSFHR